MADTDPIRVLIVDDNDFARALLERQLTEAGYAVLQAANGAQAMDVLVADGVALIITDWMMPEMDGLDLCRAIRAHEGIPFAFVIIVTARQTGQEQLLQAFDAGADDYLCKPYDFSELLARLRAGERIVHLQEDLDGKTRQAHLFNAKMAVAHNELTGANRKLHHMATTDDLTGLLNRRAALNRLSECWSFSERHGDPLAIIAIDIDRFKSCNDAHGHAAGDVVLKETAEVLRRTTRREEFACRIGGEEFLIICPRATGTDAAVLAERLRREVQAHVVESGELTLGVTISLGVAERTSDVRSPDHLLRVADDALYAAKDAGRNTVRLASQPAPDFTDTSEQGASAYSPMRPGNVRPDDPATVLVGEHDAATRLLCRTSLEREGHHVIEAVDGLEVIRKAKESAPDVIILDVGLPEMDGLQCAATLKAMPETQHVPVILAGSRSDAVGLVAGLEAGADEYLTKPLNPKELIVRVKSMARLKRELVRSNEVRGEQSRTLGILMDYSRDIAGADSLNEVLDRTMAAAASLACCRGAAILLPDADKKYLTVAGCLRTDEAYVRDIRVPIGAPTAGEVFRSRQPVVISTPDEATEHEADADIALLSGLPSLSMALCAPNQVVGVLNLTGRKDNRPFSPVELEYLELVGNIAAAAVHERLTRDARDEARNSIVFALAKLAEHRDSDTGKHLERVTRFTCLLAGHLRTTELYRAVITETFINDLERAVPLHDIGKVATPDHILLKPGALDDEERVIMSTHATVGARTIQSVLERAPGVSFLNMAEQIASSHHEWFDGAGYPAGLLGEQIPLAARITAVADVYDAVTTKRPYKEPFSHERACKIITDSSGQQFDPDVVDAFVATECEFRKLAAELGDNSSSDDDTAAASAPVPSVAGAPSLR